MPAAATEAFPTLSLLKSGFFYKNISILLIVLSEILSLSYFYKDSFKVLYDSNFFLALGKYSSSLPYYPLAILGSIMMKSAMRVDLMACTGFYKFFSSTK